MKILIRSRLVVPNVLSKIYANGSYTADYGTIILPEAFFQSANITLNNHKVSAGQCKEAKVFFDNVLKYHVKE